MPRGERSKVFLVSVMRDGEAVKTYAVVRATVVEALEAVAALCPADCTPELVGGLSRDTARALKLKSDDLREI